MLNTLTFTKNTSKWVTNIIPNDLCHVPVCANNLSLLRGISFFTTTLLTNYHEHPRLMNIETHYDRLNKNYTTLFHGQFPISIETFRQLIDQLVDANTLDQSLYQIQIIVMSQSTASHVGYSFRFDGDINKIIFQLTPFRPIQNWTTTHGIHLMTHIYQREQASKKMTNYIGAFESAQDIHACNALSILTGSSIRDRVLQYHQLTAESKSAVKRWYRDCFSSNHMNHY